MAEMVEGSRIVSARRRVYDPGMGVAETNTRRRPPPAREASPAVEPAECLFCHRTADRVTFVVQDRVHDYNVCEDCIDDCARTVACACVC